MNKNIVVLGSVNQDHIIRSHHLPQPGETVAGLKHILAAGGKGANQAVAVARLGAQVSFIACVGDDPFGLSMLSVLRADGINIDAIEVCLNESIPCPIPCFRNSTLLRPTKPRLKS